jgi:hypothetical protein
MSSFVYLMTIHLASNSVENACNIPYEKSLFHKIRLHDGIGIVSTKPSWLWVQHHMLGPEMLEVHYEVYVSMSWPGVDFL